MPVVPIVVVEMPAEIAPELATTVLRACNLALGTGRCAIAEVPASTTGNAWVASVRLDPEEPNRLRIDLRDATPQSTRTSFTRDLTFEGPEPLNHRWATAGVVVAALVVSAESSQKTDGGQPDDHHGSTPADTLTSGDVTAAHQPPIKSPNETKGHTVSTPEPPASKGNTRDFRVDLGGLIGPSIEGGTLRWGGLVRPSLELGQSVLAWTSLSAAAADDAVKAFWWSGAVGLGFVSTARNRRFGVEARLGFKAERVSLTATEGSREDSAVNLRWGGVAGVDLYLGISRPLALWLGGEAEAMLPRLDVQVGGAQKGQLDRLNSSIALGIRTRFGLDSR